MILDEEHLAFTGLRHEVNSYGMGSWHQTPKLVDTTGMDVNIWYLTGIEMWRGAVDLLCPERNIYYKDVRVWGEGEWVEGEGIIERFYGEQNLSDNKISPDIYLGSVCPIAAFVKYPNQQDRRKIVFSTHFCKGHRRYDKFRSLGGHGTIKERGLVKFKEELEGYLGTPLNKKLSNAKEFLGRKKA